MSKSIEQLKNLGPKSAQMLFQVGIKTIEDLLKRGVVTTYLDVKLSGQAASLNLLYAMFAGLQERHWTELEADEKQQLLIELEQQTQIRELINIDTSFSN
ncbi:MAG: TfoX/Sxy family protein [Kangiellaceae bacterium]|nr:TfoX/Sxy family protein [Kangiellaceae bacterium]